VVRTWEKLAAVSAASSAALAAASNVIVPQVERRLAFAAASASSAAEAACVLAATAAGAARSAAAAVTPATAERVARVEALVLALSAENKELRSALEATLEAVAVPTAVGAALRPCGLPGAAAIYIGATEAAQLDTPHSATSEGDSEGDAALKAGGGISRYNSILAAATVSATPTPLARDRLFSDDGSECGSVFSADEEDQGRRAEAWMAAATARRAASSSNRF
jgi:hypothetical protein